MKNITIRSAVRAAVAATLAATAVSGFAQTTAPTSTSLNATAGPLAVSTSTVTAPRGFGGGTIKVCPPLSITEEALRESLDVFEEAFAEAIAAKKAAA